MAISFVGSSNVSNGLAQGTSAIVPRPVGVIDGDRLLAFISIGNNGAITPPAGWSELVLATNTAGVTLQNRIYTKVAASEPASWTWTFTSAAYVGIAHATRGVGGIFAAQQSDDGIALLAHSTPVLPAPAGAWLISSWTGRNLVALGWAPPAGDTERQDVIGGLLVLLNVNHAVDDTAGSVAAGNYSKTAATLIAVRALDALVVLAPVLDPITLGELKSPKSFGSLSIEHTVTLQPPVKSPITFGSSVVEMTVTDLSVKSPNTFAPFSLEFGISVSPVPSPLTLGTFLAELTIDDPAILSPVIFGDIGLSLDMFVEPTYSTVVFDPMSVEFELDLNMDVFTPIDFGTQVLNFDIQVPAILSPWTSGDMVVLPEGAIMIFPHLRIPIIPGSGGLWNLVLAQTFDADVEPGMIMSPAQVGDLLVYQEIPYGGSCC